MKKILIVIGLIVALGVSAQPAFQFKSLSFLNEAQVRSITVSNANAAPFGSLTNVLSWSYNGIQTTNTYGSFWTNTSGTKIFPTNNVAGTDPAGIHFVFGDTTPLLLDVPLWVDGQGRLPFTIITNGGPTTTFLDTWAYSPMSVSMSFTGDASVSGSMNVIFVGVPDGTNEINSSVNPALFQWGVTTAAGSVVISTNFPIWKFTGCKAVRVRSITGVTGAAASGVTIYSLKLNGFVP